MSIQSMKNQTFPAVSYEEWKQNAEAALKGKPFESLLTKTAEGVTLQPLYTEEMFRETGELLENRARLIRQGKGHASFLTAQEVEALSARTFLDQAKEELKRGNEMIVYNEISRVEWSDSELGELKDLVLQHPFYFKLGEGDHPVLQLFGQLSEDEADRLNGVILTEEELDMPRGVRTFCADTLPVHHAGGTAIHELGAALSILTEKIAAGEAAGRIEKSWVRFAVDTDFFSEIAKLRAFRVLWAAFCEAFGAEVQPVPVFTETSLRSFSKLDPYVNLLRAGNATFSAVLGGTDVHTVMPHDVLTGVSPASRRMARNVSLIIKEETLVGHVQDAAAGSYYIEQLTNEYIEAGWEMFKTIEKAGGYSEVLQSGWLADELQAAWQLRKERVATRKVSLIGTNNYADPAEQLPEQSEEKRPEAMTAKRLAEPFEQLRSKLAQSGLKTAILHFGPLKEVKVKSDYVRGVLAVGGLEPAVSGELKSGQEAAAFLAEKGAAYGVLIGSTETLEAFLPALQDTGAVLDVAGRYGEEEMARLKALGVSGAVHAGQHLPKKLLQIAEAGKGGN